MSFLFFIAIIGLIIYANKSDKYIPRQQQKNVEKFQPALKTVKKWNEELEKKTEQLLDELEGKTKFKPNPPQTDFTKKLLDELKQYESPKEKPKPTEWTLEVLLSLEWKRFEEVCREYLIATGLNARLTQSGADGGIDIEIYKENNTLCLVQCKAWVWKISVKEIRELYGIMASEKVNNGIFITTSSYTQDAITFSKEKNIRLFDGKDLVNRIKNLPAEQQQKLLDFALSGDYTTPTCARCEQKMVKRTAKNSGTDFWGCVNFPRCRSTIQMRKA